MKLSTLIAVGGVAFLAWAFLRQRPLPSAQWSQQTDILSGLYSLPQGLFSQNVSQGIPL